VVQSKFQPGRFEFSTPPKFHKALHNEIALRGVAEMSSTPEGAASMPPPNETPSQKQARLRRERRQAKIQAQGESRLAAITNVSGRRAPPAETRESGTISHELRALIEKKQLSSPVPFPPSNHRTSPNPPPTLPIPQKLIYQSTTMCRARHRAPPKMLLRAAS